VSTRPPVQLEQAENARRSTRRSGRCGRCSTATTSPVKLTYAKPPTVWRPTSAAWVRRHRSWRILRAMTYLRGYKEPGKKHSQVLAAAAVFLIEGLEVPQKRHPALPIYDPPRIRSSGDRKSCFDGDQRRKFDTVTSMTRGPAHQLLTVGTTNTYPAVRNRAQPADGPPHRIRTERRRGRGPAGERSRLAPDPCAVLLL